MDEETDTVAKCGSVCEKLFINKAVTMSHYSVSFLYARLQHVTFAEQSLLKASSRHSVKMLSCCNSSTSGEDSLCLDI